MDLPGNQYGVLMLMLQKYRGAQDELADIPPISRRKEDNSINREGGSTMIGELYQKVQCHVGSRQLLEVICLCVVSRLVFK